MTIRSRLDADLPACVDLLAAVHNSDRYPVEWPPDPSKFVQSRREIDAWVAEAHGAMLGHVALHGGPLDPWFELATAATGLKTSELVVVSRLFVSPLTRRAGLASALLDRAVTAAHARGSRPVLDVGANLIGAVALYESSGWTHLGDVVYTFADVPIDAHVYLGPAPTQCP